MSWTAFFLVLVSVFLHAGWNFLSKSGRPSAAFYLVMSMTSATIWLPFFLFSGLDAGKLPFSFWLYWIGSGVCEVLYVLGLFKAYSKCDISMAYPLARALPVLMVAAVTIVFGIGRIPGAAALAGMVVVSAGCLLMPLRSLREFSLKSYLNPAIGAILLAAAGTTGYTVLDSMALPLFREAARDSALVGCGAYLFGIEAMLAIGLGWYVARRRRERAEFRRLFLKSAYPSLAGIFASGCYILILLAMGHVTNVSFIQAFRQMSLPLGVLAGIFILKESHAPVKLIGIGLVIAGLVMVSLN